TLSMVQNRTMTIPGNITGPGGLTKSYGFGALAGTTVNLTLSGTNDFAGDFTIFGGGVRFNSDASAGKGRVIVSMPVGGVANATLRNLGVALSTLTNEVVFNANNGLIITLDSDVPNTFAMSGNFSGIGAVVHGANTGGTVVLSGDNSAWSGGMTARRGTLRLNHKNALGSGQYVVAPSGAAGAMAVSLQAGISLTGVNAITNSVQFASTNISLVLTSSWFTVSGTNDIDLAGPISLGISGSSSPVITNLNTGATILSGVISGVGFGFTKVGAGTLTISNGANGFDGGTVINEGAVKIINGSGSALGSGSVTIGALGTLTGSGSASGAVAVSGTVAPGSSVGTLGSGSETWAGGGHYVFEINQAAGTAGTSPGWDKLNITGGLNITATSGNKFIINITSLTLANAPGAVSDFSEINSYSWVIASTTTGVTGFDTNAFTLNTNNFVNGLGSGSFSLSIIGNDLILNFTGASVAQPPSSFVTTSAGQGTFSGSPNTTYTVQYADILASPTTWLTLTNVLTDGAGVGAFNDPSAPGGQPQRFYRVRNP
ncbi:MAG: autotransporter-associated beta strand repeat-containing protein, partial [Verrucomicrobiota bacterium]